MARPDKVIEGKDIMNNDKQADGRIQMRYYGPVASQTAVTTN